MPVSSVWDHKLLEGRDPFGLGSTALFVADHDDDVIRPFDLKYTLDFRLA